MIPSTNGHPSHGPGALRREPSAARQAGPEAPRRRAWLFPGIVFGLLGTQFGICGLAIYLANADPSFAIEPDYYRKAVAWDQENARRHASVALGWQLDFAFADEADALGRRQLTCSLRDRDGRPIRGATIEVAAFASARGNQRETWTLDDTGDGSYEAFVTARRPGLWELRTTVAAAGHVFVDRRTCEITDSPRSRTR